MSFVLQFVEHDSGPKGTTWRGALHEVESNARHPVAKLDDIADGLAAHGVDLPGPAGGNAADGSAADGNAADEEDG